MKREVVKQVAGASNPQDVVEILVLKLCQKGLLFRQIPRFIKDVLLIISNSAQWTPASLNQKLDWMGWGKQVLDEFTLQLIVFLLENHEECPVPVPMEQ